MKAQRSGRMLFTSSITGPHVTSPGHGHYAATKAGINGFIRSAALEFAGYGITVNGVEPGNILTESIQQQRGPEFIRSMEDAIPLGRLGAPRDVANAFLFLASDEASYITGTTIVVDGGQLLPEGKDFRILPKALDPEEDGDTGIFVGTGDFDATSSFAPVADNNKVINNKIGGYAIPIDDTGSSGIKVHANKPSDP